MKKFILFAVFALLFVGFLAALGEAEGKSPPGVETGYYDLQSLAPGVSVEVEKPVSIEIIRPAITGQLYAIHKTEAAVVRRHDRRLWSIYAKEVKSLYAYGHLLYERRSSLKNACGQLLKKGQVFKTEYS